MSQGALTSTPYHTKEDQEATIKSPLD